MHAAFSQQFDNDNLDPKFVAGITTGAADRLLYVHLLGSRKLQDCLQFKMTDTQKEQHACLHLSLLSAVEDMHESHVALRCVNYRESNEATLIGVMQQINLLADTLSKVFAARVRSCSAVAIGPWPASDFFIEYDNIPHVNHP